MDQDTIENLKVFVFQISYIFDTSKCATNCIISFEVYDGFNGQKVWSNEGRKVGHSAQIQPKSQFLFHKNLPPRDFSVMILGANIHVYQSTK